ncbi:MAG: hypothetical protein JJU22_04640 [Gammaproteobacteria bacterium]|nr:hypothetical protein [Gammaproteobacteria bacterium]
MAKPLSSDSDPERAGGSRLLLKILLAVLLVVVLLVMAAPTLLSSGPGRGFVLGMVNDRLPGSVAMDALSLSWLGSQRAEGVRVRDPEGADVIALESFTTELSLLGALRGRLGLGETRIRGLRVAMEVDEEGQDNLSRALGLGPADEPGGPILIPVTGHIILEDGGLSWSAPGLQPVVLEDLAGFVRLHPANRDLEVEFAGRSRQGDMIGTLAIEGRVRNWLDADGALTPATAEPELDAQLDNLPLRLVDGLAGLDGLLVAALGDRMAVRLASSDRQVDITVEAPRLALDLAADLRDQRLVLTRPGALRWQLTPEFVALLGGEGEDPLRLAEAVDLRLALERLEAPLTGFDPGLVALRGRFDSSAALRLTGGGLGALRLEGLAAEVMSDRLAEAVTLTAGFGIQSEGRTGRFDIDASVQDLFDDAGQLQTDRLKLQAQANIKDLPTPLVDRLAGTDGLLVAALGPRLDLDARASTGDDNRIDASLDVTTEHLRAEGIRLRVDDVITLTDAARIRYRLTPAVLAQLAPDADMRLRAPADLELIVTTLRAPRPGPGEPALQPQNSRLQARFSSAGLDLEDAAGVRTRIGDLRVEIDGDSLAAMKVRGQAAVNQGAPGALATLGASPMNLRLEFDGGLAPDATLLASQGRIELVGGALEARIPFRISAGMETLTLSAPASLSLPLTPAFMAGLLTGEDSESDIRLADSALLRITLDRLDVGLVEPGLTKVRANGKAELGRMRFLAGNRPLAAVDALSAELQFQGAEGRGKVTLDGRVSAEGSEPGTLKGTVDIENLRPDGTGNLKLDLDLAKLPAALLAIFVDQPALPELLGSALDVKVTSQLALGEVPRGSASLRANARHLSADAELDLGDAISLKRPAQVRLTLTPAAHAALSPATAEPDPGRMLVAADTVIDASVTRLRMLRGDAGVGRLPDLDARISIPQAQLRHTATNERYVMENLVANVGTESAGRQLVAKLTGSVAERGATPGAIDLNVRMGELFDAEGAFSTERLALDVQGRIAQLPVAVVDRFLASDGLMVASLGRTIDARIDAELREGVGPVSFELRGGNAQADVKAHWNQGTVTLRETLSAQLQPTEEFGRKVLARIHPIFDTMRGGKDPIRLQIPAQGVSIPTGEGALGQITVPELSLALGRIELESGPLLEGLVALGQRFGNLRPMGDVWPVEFTPAVMSMREGRLAYSRRMDLLLGDQMHFATWGGMDLVNQRADLVLGVMPLTLRSVFGVAANENDALRIPIQGAAGVGMINVSQVGMELARLQASRRLGQSNPLFGAVLGAAAGGTPGLTGAPQPSVSPLPWAERLAAQAARAEEEARQREQQQRESQQQVPQQ